jgi:hypothetical protein
MGTSQRVGLGSLLGFAVTAAAIVGVSVVVVSPEGRSGHFWWQVAWACFLAAIVWTYVGGFAGASAGLGRAFATTAACYAVVSGMVLLGAAILPDTSALSRAHLATQIVLGAAMLVVWVFIYFSRATSQHEPGGG